MISVTTCISLYSGTGYITELKTVKEKQVLVVNCVSVISFIMKKLIK